MNASGTIWDEHVFGNTFNGKAVNLFGEAFCVDEKTPLVILGESGSPLGGDISESRNFFEAHGFSVRDIHNMKEETEELLEQYLLSLPYLRESVVILTKDRLWRRCEPIFRKHGIRSQLFSRISAFYTVFRPSLRKAYELFEEGRSKEVFSVAAAVRYKLLPDEAIWPYEEREQYFVLPQMRKLSATEVFVDCGAFVGDTVEAYLNTTISFFRYA